MSSKFSALKMGVVICLAAVPIAFWVGRGQAPTPVVNQSATNETNHESAPLITRAVGTAQIAPTLLMTNVATNETTVAAPTAQEQRRASFRANHQRQVELLATTFEQQATDPTWSRAATGSLRKLYQGKEFAGLTTQVECRSTLCRVNFSYSDPNRGGAAVQRVIVSRPWKGRAFTRHDTRAHSGLLYIGREGTKFPHVDSSTLHP